MNEPLSNVDINKAIKQFEKKGANIFLDKDIKENTPLEKIFNNRGHCILFHQYPDQEVGHWWTLLRDPNKTVFVIDSFGENPNKYNKNLLKCLKNNGIKNVIINKQKWQGEKSAVCGRYGLLLTTLHKLNLPIDEMYTFMNNGKKKYGSFDKFVLHLTT